MENRWSKGSPSKLNTFDNTTTTTYHCLCSYWKLDKPLSIWSHLLWWNLLSLSFSLPSDVHHSHTDRWDYVSSYICFPSQQEWTGLHEIFQSCSENYDNQQPTFFTHHSINGLRESSTERNPLSMSWNYHQRLLFPLYTVYMAQSTDDRSKNSIQEQRGHQKTGQTCSCIATCSWKPSRGRMVSLFAGFGWHRPPSRHNAIYRLHHSPVDWTRPYCLESHKHWGP